MRRSLWGGWKVLWLDVRGLWEEVWRLEVGGEEVFGRRFGGLRWEVRGLWEKVWRFEVGGSEVFGRRFGGFEVGGSEVFGLGVWAM